MPLLPKTTRTPTSQLNNKLSTKSLEKDNLKPTEFESLIPFFNGQQMVRIANRLELRQKAYEYVYKVYLNEGYIKSRDNKYQLTIYNALPNTTTLYAEDHDGNFNGTFTMVFDSDMGLPSYLQYQKEIDKLRTDNRRICEIISFGIDRTQRGSVMILAGLFYCAYLIAWHIMEATDFIINVIPSQADFYCKNILFRKIGNTKECPRTDGVPAVLLNLPISLTRKLKRNKRLFPFSMINYSEQEEVELARKLERMILPMSDIEFYTFFIEKTDLWYKASDIQKDYIKKLYPADLTDHSSISRALAKTVSNKYQNQKNNPK
jgi:hypothetical protein